VAKNYPPEPPYRWRPLGTDNERRPEAGRIVAWRHMAWRVVECAPVPEADWSQKDRETVATYKPGWRAEYAPWTVVIRPAAITGDDPRGRDSDVHLRVPAGWHYGFDTYPDEHYPVCAQCGEPVPCRETKARELTEAASRKADRYSLPGVCPACQEMITARQKVLTFGENLYVPFGPEVTFHVGRRDCCHSAAEYEKKWAEMAPGRITTLSCPGHVWMHADGAECSEGDDCRGLKTEHAHRQSCDHRCLRCRDARVAPEDEIAARNARGDWTVWRAS
jgi:hypothetical protein